MEALVDSNVYVYRALKDSAYHAKARELLEELLAWVTPTLVIHEVVWTLHELLGRRPTLEYSSRLLAHRKLRLVPVVEQDIRWAVSRIESENISLARYNDKVVLAVARRLEVPLLSFDKQLLSQASRSGVEVINPYRG